MWFIGGLGADTVTGGSGGNSYIYGSTSESVPGNGKFDTITNFAFTFDSIDLRGIGAALTYFGQEPTGAKIPAQSIAWQQSGGDTLVYVNTSGIMEATNKADMEIALHGTLPLTTNNFLHL